MQKNIYNTLDYIFEKKFNNLNDISFYHTLNNITLTIDLFDVINIRNKEILYILQLILKILIYLNIKNKKKRIYDFNVIIENIPVK